MKSRNLGHQIVTGLWFQVVRESSKIFGSFAAGFGETLPASNKARTLKFQFRSNKKKNAGGFRCQVLVSKLV